MALKEIHTTLVSRWPRWWLRVKIMHYWLRRSMGFPKVQKVYKSRCLFLSQKPSKAKTNAFLTRHDQNFVPKICHNFLQWRIKARDNYVNVRERWSLLVTETWNLFSSEPFSRGDEVPTQVIKKCDSCQGEWRRDCNRKNGRIWAIAWVLNHRISDMWISHCEMFFKTNIQQKVEKCVSDIGQREFRNIKLPVFRPRHEDCSACWELKHLDEYIRLKASRSPCPRDWLE